MTIDEAIKILERNAPKTIPSGEIAHLDAVKLGIEALKRTLRQRKYLVPSSQPLLPGETKD